jgi:hypothetical protein
LVDRNRDPRAKKVISEPKHFRPSGPADEFQPSIPRPKLPLPAPSSANGTGNRAESHRKSGEAIDHHSGSCYVHKSPIAADQNRPKEVDRGTNEDRRHGGSSDFSRFVLLSCVRRKICDFVDLAKRSRRNHCWCIVQYISHCMRGKIWEWYCTKIGEKTGNNFPQEPFADFLGYLP